MTLRILVADDHVLFAQGLCALFESEPDMEVVGSVRDGRAAVSAALELEPDLVTMDLSMPGLSGMEATRQITSQQPATPVLCLSMHRERSFLQAAFEAGAAGYVLKDCDLAELIDAARRVAQGETHLCPEMTVAAVEEYRSHLAMPGKGGSEPTLTAREREVLQLVAEGLSSREAAAVLGISERTVTTHRRHLTDKLDIHSVAGLTKYAIRHGITTAERNPHRLSK